jgi:hypothetical protein
MGGVWVRWLCFRIVRCTNTGDFAWLGKTLSGRGWVILGERYHVVYAGPEYVADINKQQFIFIINYKIANTAPSDGL